MKLQLPTNPNRGDTVKAGGYIFEFQEMDNVIPVRIGNEAFQSAIHLKRKMVEMGIEATTDTEIIWIDPVTVLTAPEMEVSMTAVDNNLFE